MGGASSRQRDSALSFVPYFARYPYETFVAPRATHANIAELSPHELDDLADGARRNARAHGQPVADAVSVRDGVAPGARRRRAHRGFHFHIEIHPPLRKPGLLKYLAGPEIGGGNFLNDTAPEDKAAELRATSDDALPRGRRRCTHELTRGDCFRRFSRCTTAFARRCSTRSRRRHRDDLADVAHDDEGDTIYAVDRVSEATLVDGLADVAREEPLVLVAEGLPAGGPNAAARHARTRIAGGDCSSTRSTARAASCTRSGRRGFSPASRRTAAPPLGCSDIVLAVQTEIPLAQAASLRSALGRARRRRAGAAASTA